MINKFFFSKKKKIITSIHSDTAELHQAVLFLHENGVLLHYNDSTLRDFYFLDPQWLCDMLAQVVTIKEINPFVKNGVMKIDDINQLIKTSTGQAGTDRKYILSLLNKFEVALTWDLRTLLIPSLLPLTEDEPENTITLKVCLCDHKKNFKISNHQINIRFSNRLCQSHRSEKCPRPNRVFNCKRAIDRRNYLVPPSSRFPVYC